MGTNHPHSLESGLIYRLETFFTYLAGAAIGLMMVLTTADVILRRTINYPIPGLMELIEEWLMIGAIYLPCSFVYIKGGHVKVELFEKSFPERLRHAISLVSCVIGLFVFAVLLYGTAPKMITAFTRPVLTDSSLGYCMGYSYLMICIGAALMCLRTVEMFFCTAKQGKNPPEEKAEES